MAAFAPLVAVAGFPPLPFWVLESELHALGLDTSGLTIAVLFLWPLTTTAFCVIALWRVQRSQGRLRGLWFAVAGLAIQSLGVLATFVLMSLFSFR